MAIGKKAEAEIQIMEVSRGHITFCVLGTSPLICNAMSEKARHELLLPAPKKNAAARASSIKHNPIEEYRNSIYRAKTDDADTRILMPATAFKGALMSAALDIPGSSKSQIGRLCYIKQDYISIYGTPQLLMSVTRCADIKRTPDVRTRAILPHWAAFVEIEFTKPILKDQSIVNLFAAAGITCGIGDWRIQKGNGNYGGFQLVGMDDPQFKRIVETGGCDAQDEALKDPQTYDSETDNLLAWFRDEVKRRGLKEVA